MNSGVVLFRTPCSEEERYTCRIFLLQFEVFFFSNFFQILQLLSDSDFILSRGRHVEDLGVLDVLLHGQQIFLNPFPTGGTHS